MKITLRDCYDYVITAEFLWFGVILHIDVLSPWSKTLRKTLISEARQIASEYSYRKIYACAPTNENKKLHKFIQLVGLVFDHYRYNHNGDSYKFYRLFPLD